MAKKVLFAHTKEIIQFDSEEEIQEYLDKQIFPCKLLDKKKLNGKFVITFIKAYNKTPLLEELSEDEKFWKKYPPKKPCEDDTYDFETGV